MSRLLLGWIIVLSVVAQQCDLSLGDLDQYVVTYELQVTNSSPVAFAAVTVQMKGVTRASTMGKGKSVSVIGFSGGAYTVSVVDIGLRLKQLKSHRDLLKTLIDTAADPAEVAQLQPQLQATLATIATVQSGAGATTCTGTVAAGKSVTIVLSEQAGQWHC